MPYLLINTYNGVELPSIVFGEKSHAFNLGEHTYVEITDEQAATGIDALYKWYKEKNSKTAEQLAAEEAHKKKGDELLERLADIIRQSHHEGERENAKALYAKYAGKPFVK